ncbi:hypothetical protein EU545_04825 [Candidatus Thorarchaeota archaeon]|nr:MAG: hypothetical protein EU545_04825 [Candidatus Thorarchaeota archaeon]
MRFSPKDVFDILDVDPNTSEIQVLKTIIQLSEKGTKNMTAKRIHEEYIAREHKNVSPSWIYKCLKVLENEGLVAVDSMRRPQQYDASPSILRDAMLLRLKKIRQRKQTELNRQKKHLNLLKSIDIEKVARHVFEEVLGAGRIVEERVVEGIEAVRHVMVEELVSKGGKGDIFRTIQPLASVHSPNIAFGTFEEEALEAMKRGLQVKALLVPPEEDIDLLQTMSDYFGGYSHAVRNLIEAGTLELRMLREHRNTYRMMCLNTQTMLLFISELYLPDTAAVFYHHDSYPIISDALDLFSKLWHNALDFGMEIVRSEN